MQFNTTLIMNITKGTIQNFKKSLVNFFYTPLKLELRLKLL